MKRKSDTDREIALIKLKTKMMRKNNKLTERDEKEKSLEEKDQMKPK